jgi:hypothetical protein
MADHPRADLTPREIARWHRTMRADQLHEALMRSEDLRWSSSLFRALIEELYVDDGLERLLGLPLDRIRRRDYPRAIALALLLRHSWLPHDLSATLERLGLSARRRQKGAS